MADIISITDKDFILSQLGQTSPNKQSSIFVSLSGRTIFLYTKYLYTFFDETHSLPNAALYLVHSILVLYSTLCY